MRRLHLALLTVIWLLVGYAPAHAQTYFPFGSVAVGVSSSGVRVGPFGCYVTTANPTYTTGQIHPCSLTTDGRIRVDTGAKFTEETVHVSGDPGISVFGVRGASCGSALSGGNVRYQPFQFDALGNLCMNIATNSAGSATDTDDGTVDDAQANVALVLGLPLVFDGTVHVRRQGFHLLDDAVFTPTADGVAVAGFFADEASTDSVSEGDTGAARITLDRKQIVSSYPHTAGGLAIHRSIDLDEGTGEVVKSAPGQVYAAWITNTGIATRFVKFYNATSCTMGTGTPVLTLPIPGNASDDITGSFGPGALGIEFTTGICVGATTGVADTDTGAPGANEVVVNIFFK